MSAGISTVWIPLELAPDKLIIRHRETQLVSFHRHQSARTQPKWILLIHPDILGGIFGGQDLFRGLLGAELLRDAGFVVGGETFDPTMFL